jgi:hypothetical protein
MDKEIIYKKLNEVLDLMESRRVYDAQIQLKGFVNEIKDGIYNK